MQLLAEQSVAIACSVETAFAYVANMENFRQWFPGVRAIVSNNALPHGTLGKEYLETVATPSGDERKILVRVREVEPNKRFVTEGHYPPLLPRMEATFAPSDVGCVVTWRMFSRNDGLLIRFTLLRLARRVLRERAALGIKQLRQQLERT